MPVILFGIVCSALASLLFSTWSIALRDFSRAKLEDALTKRRRSQWLQRTVDEQSDLVFAAAVGRLLANLVMLLFCVRLFDRPGLGIWAQYSAGGVLALVLGLVFSVSLPMAIARYAGESLIAASVQFLHALRTVLYPAAKIMHLFDTWIRNITGARSEPEPEQVEKDILSAVEEGEKEGVVGEEQREMIESVIEFRDTNVEQTMTARPEVVALEVGATLEEVKRTIEESGHSRLPVYDGTLDHIVGILYARDLMKYLGTPAEHFDLRSAIRPAIFVPETKPLRDLLHEFKLQKVHIAIVLDEYGGTVGLVTIEDILEELVGEITDEHEPHEPAMFKRLSESSFEADARLRVDEVNQQCGLNLPEDAGFETLGGFVVSVLGRIPTKGATFEHSGARFTVLDAEPQRVVRLKIDLLAQAARE